ncbi:MAG: TetR/AcrR family transcriptional regulator [Parvibaculum sp.]|uniref:TetR/AcrR family transcriptional regulator n=1 Tax=Parvibaculum sp. TaxID=2024848 RepID=UPI0025E1C610|nr:TetR/AcrR family transcriptional regulator [Parvibaculum sp.]MCE9650768.1 TetR/AcrR family transcriptional regulator [Parvibaculum sp.]
MGRPREFDEDEVLKAAGEVFWSHGYEGTSTRDLTNCTGLTPASMYNAFGDKRGLYVRSLEHYLKTILHERIARLDALGSPARAIAGYFREVIDRSLSDPEHRGCMLVNTALAATPDDPELQRLVADETAAIERFFHRQILAGQKSGELPRQQSADDLARMLLAVVMGLRVLVRVRPDAALLEGLARPALAMLNIPWPRGKRSAR